MAVSGAGLPLTGRLRRQLFFLTLAGLCLALSPIGRSWQLLLIYDRQAVLAGELWRVLTAHVVHVGWAHLTFDLAGLGLVWLAFWDGYSNRQWLTLWLACAAGISLGLLAFEPEVAAGAGLSGVLHGLFAAGALAHVAKGERSGIVFLVLLLVKIIWEQAVGPVTGGVLGGTTGIQAHLYGVVSGLCAAAALGRRRRQTT